MITPPYDMTMYPADTLTAPQQSYKATKTGQLKVRPKISLNLNLLGDAKIALTVKKRGGQLLGKRIFEARDTSPFSGKNLDLTVPVTMRRRALHRLLDGGVQAARPARLAGRVGHL